MSIGRRPNSADPRHREDQGRRSTPKGFIEVDAQRRTAEPTIYAIGDVAGEPMLAHKATYEAEVAVEAIAGHKVAYEPRAIPAVVFTDPEMAWCGLTEAGSQAGQHPATRSPSSRGAPPGRATSIGRTDGLTKIIIDPKTERVLGVGIVGAGAGEMIAEGALAVEMGAVADDLAMTIHAHPTLSETVMESAEGFFGHATHVFRPKRRSSAAASAGGAAECGLLASMSRRLFARRSWSACSVRSPATPPRPPRRRLAGWRRSAAPPTPGSSSWCSRISAAPTCAKASSRP